MRGWKINLWTTLALVLCTSMAAQAADADVASRITAAAAGDGAGYLLERDALVADGADVLPALTAVAENAAWREAAAAGAVIGWIEQAEAYASFQDQTPRATASGHLRYGPPHEPRGADLVPLLVEQLLWAEADAGRRTAAADLLQRKRDARATLPLAWTLREDPSDTVRQAAAQALERAEDPAATGVLIEALPVIESGAVREAVASALSWRKDAEAVPALVALLTGDEHDGCRATAAQGLGWIGDTRALATLQTALGSDPTAEVRQHAALALGRLGGDEAREALEGAIETDADAEVVRLATHALGRL
ncbi:MAG: HEAT repeat domain-containing protein [Myxococcota bacterium]|jgi:HEAT repeat protein|nr:HEAT repeat domain-containing protein [Myxococcota bacterium]